MLPWPLKIQGRHAASHPYIDEHLNYVVASTAPELLTSPTRNFTSHTGRAATLYQRVPEALASLVDFDLSWTLVTLSSIRLS
jgi:hypothetical protein